MRFAFGNTPLWETLLNEEVAKLQKANNYKELTLTRFKDIVNPPNEAELLNALATLVSKGKLKVIYRVISPFTKASIATFDSPLDVPESLLDESTGEVIDIDRFRNVEAVYISEVRRER